MFERSLRVIVLSAFAGLLLQAQENRITGPVSGYVFDPAAHALRPVLGLPGASLLGDGVQFSFDVKSAFMAPRQDAAFVVAADGSVHLFRIDPDGIREISLDGLALPERLVFSPSGTAAALYGGGSIEVVSGLPDKPGVSGGVDLRTGTQLDSMAISDDGKVLLVSADSSVRLFGSFTELSKLIDTAGNAFMAFTPGGHDAAVADPAGAGILLYHDLTGAGDSRVLAAPDDKLAALSGLAFAPDGKTLLTTAGQSVTEFNLAGGDRTSLACSCAVQGLTRMGNTFRLNEIGGDPLWLLDTRTSERHLLFVPALQ
jgi:hypothetical protein